MSPELQIIVTFAVFLVLLTCGMAVPFAIAVPALFYLLLQGGLPALNSLGLVSWGSMTAMFMSYIGVHAKIRPQVAPHEAGPGSMKELVAALLDVLPFALLIAGTLGGIYRGLVTTTEGATIGCILAIILGATFGSLTPSGVIEAMRNTIKFSGNILFIIFTAYVFSHAISFAGVGEKVTAFIVGLDLTRLEFFFALFILYTVLGCLIESLGMIVITVPLIFPVLPNYGIDPILFGVVLVLFVELGQISPPIGINLFVIQGIWDGNLSEVILGTIPFHLTMFVVLALVILWPDLALWLPQHMSK
jgi:C4-dicarboxylate transporter, DctM subunit